MCERVKEIIGSDFIFDKAGEKPANPPSRGTK